MTDTMDILGDFVDRYRRNPKIEDMAINIIIDDGDCQNPIFVEIETDDGRSIRIGTRTTRDDGLTSIRITAPEVIEIG